MRLQKVVNGKWAVRKFLFTINMSHEVLSSWFIYLMNLDVCSTLCFYPNICLWRDQGDKYALYDSSVLAYIFQLVVSFDRKQFCRMLLLIEFSALCRYNVSVFAPKTETREKLCRDNVCACLCFVQRQRFKTTKKLSVVKNILLHLIQLNSSRIH